MLTKREKVYTVEFMGYTNITKNTVSTYYEGCDKATIEYLDVSNGPFLIKESDLDKYKKFGGGYRDIHFVGYIEV